MSPIGFKMRIWDAIKVGKAIKHFLKTEEQVDVVEWLSDPANIVLENKKGDIAIFEYGLPTKKIYAGHYYFKSRGKEAIDSGKELLDEFFNSCYNTNILIGMVPVQRKDVKWITRKLGFKSYGIEEARGNQYELFIQTKKEFNNEFSIRNR